MGDDVAFETYQAITRLKSRYFWAIDRHRWAELDELYTPDAGFEGFAFPTATPREFVDGVARYLEGITSAHEGFNPILVAVDPNRVRGRWSMHDVLVWEPGSRGPEGGAETSEQWGIHGYGYYEDEYRRTSDGWRISFQRLVRTLVRPLDDPSAGRLAVLSGPVPRADWV